MQVTYPREIDPGERLDRGWQLPEQLVDFGRRAVGAAQQDDLVRLGQRRGDLGGDLKFWSRLWHANSVGYRKTSKILPCGLCQHLWR